MNLTIQSLAQQLGNTLSSRSQKITTAESCTGGGIGEAITCVPGSSAWFEYGFITYSNSAKTALLGVNAATIDAHGAVSEAVVTAMAEGARRRAGSDYAVAVSGIAGPGGGTEEKPVGTVWLAWCNRDGTYAQCEHFHGNRDSIRNQTVIAALQGLDRWLPLGLAGQ